ncbi:MAG: peptide deformylase [Rhizobiaceae bacterium]|nr:peptide deformylase [Rhizobiaceae bacterium]
MPARPIVRFPDPRLKAVALEVAVFDAELRQLAAELLDTMRAAPGVGITAPHIGVAQRVVVLQLPGDMEATTYVNPAITWASDERITHVEGSVSMPGVTEEIERRATVGVTYRDLDGTECYEEASGFRAVCHQHEIDQLDGIFWIQRLSALKRERLVKRYQKTTRRG